MADRRLKFFNKSGNPLNFDYVGPTGRRSPNGMIRQVKQSDFTKIIDENIDFKIQKNDSGELILHYIQP